MKKVILIILAVLGLFFFLQSQNERLERHNKYQCAVYGLKPDCETPLPINERLK